MVHELRVHQIELEMQNEELRRTHAALEKENQEYLDLYEFAPMGYCTLSEQGRIMAANLTATTMIAMTRNTLIGQQISRFICDEDRHTFAHEMSDTTHATLGSPFTQASEEFTRTHQGAGLGLSICKRLVSTMGGTLTVDSTQGVGTTAYLMLPFRRRTYSTLPDQPGAVSATPSLRILLVEDDETRLVAETQMLKKMGHTVQTATNGIEALKSMRRNTFDCVLMDVQMEFMDGLEATKNIRADVSKFFDPKIPIVAMTAYAMRGNRERFILAGMNHSKTLRPHSSGARAGRH